MNEHDKDMESCNNVNSQSTLLNSNEFLLNSDSIIHCSLHSLNSLQHDDFEVETHKHEKHSELKIQENTDIIQHELPCLHLDPIFPTQESTILVHDASTDTRQDDLDSIKSRDWMIRNWISAIRFWQYHILFHIMNLWSINLMAIKIHKRKVLKSCIHSWVYRTILEQKVKLFLEKRFNLEKRNVFLRWKSHSDLQMKQNQYRFVFHVYFICISFTK